MYWYLFFMLFVLVLSLPIKFKTIINFNLLKQFTEVNIKIFRLNIVKFRVKIKNNYIYLTKKAITYKQKFSTKNIEVVFVLKLIQELYYRIQLQEFEEIGEFGISDNAVATALFASSFDICLKGILTKIKNNKKFSHILITNNPKYNDDCVSIKLNSEVRINIFDIIYSFVSSKLKSKGDKYERTKQREQSEITD